MTVTELCKLIESIQLKLIQNKPQQVGESLDFQYTLANELSSFLQKCFKQRQHHYPNRVIVVIQKIFESFIVFESDFKSNSQKLIDSSKNYIMLIKDFFKPNLSQKQYLHLVIQIVKNFILKPVNQKDCASKDLYSQIKVLNALNMIQIPNEELLSFIAQKLGI